MRAGAGSEARGTLFRGLLDMRLSPEGSLQLRDGLRSRVPRASLPPMPLIEIPVVDRETARKNMGAGLVAGAFAAVIFALCFVAAFLYIAQ